MPIFGLRISSREGWQYHRIDEPCKVGDLALVELDRGQIIARVDSGPIALLPGVEEADLPGIVRVARGKDLEAHAANEALCKEAKAFCKGRIAERKLDMKLVDVEVFFDRSKFIFYFTAPGRVDFRELVKDLVRAYKARIELRQIGVRHDTQRLGAIGNC